MAWTTGKVAWFDSVNAVRPPSKVELFDLVAKTSTTFAPPTGCFLFGQTTVRHLFVSCFTSDLVAAHDLPTGKGVPLGPLVFAGADAIAVRSTAEMQAGEGVWLHAAVFGP